MRQPTGDIVNGHTNAKDAAPAGGSQTEETEPDVPPVTQFPPEAGGDGRRPAVRGPSRGLSTAEAAERLTEHGPNEVGVASRIPWWSRVLAQLRDPLIMVLLAAVVLTVAIGDHPDAAVIALVIVVNTTVGVAQEVRADHAVEALAALSAPTARVIRDGVENPVPAADVVPGDVVALGEGDIVPADGVLLETSALLVDESAVTGESVPVEKAVNQRGARFLRSGTVVAHGRGLAEVTATGAASSMGQVAALLRPRATATPLQRRLAGLGRVLAVVTVVLCLLVLALGLLRGLGPRLMAVTAISLAVAAVPESLPAVVTLSLALGARRMAGRHAIVRRLPAVETLGSVTVLATDKTGTLTEGVMSVERVWTPWAEAVLRGSGYRPEGEMELSGPDRTDSSGARHPVVAVLRAAALCNDAALVPPTGAGGDWTASGDPMEAALLTAAHRAGLDPEALRRNHPRISEVPFDSRRRRMSTAHRTPDGVVEVNLKGAPEAVLVQALLEESPELLAGAHREAGRLADEGYRVLAVARRTWTGPLTAPERYECRLRLLGLLAIADPPKASAAATLAACRRAGITPILITGDHPGTAAAIARRLGLLDPAGEGTGQVVTAADGACGEDLTGVRVFARTDPRRKLEIVRAWRDNGQITAMTGDGVNDGPALREADIGVAMGHRGTEVARQAADLVLADDDIATVVSAVEEGRRIYDNIRRFLLYAVSGGVAEIAVMLIGPWAGLPLPLRAGQILWINLLTHGLTGVAMGAEPPATGAMERRPRPPGEHVLGGGLWQRILGVAAAVTAAGLGAGLWYEHSGGPWQSVLFISLLIAQLGVCAGLRNRWWTLASPWLPAAVLASLLLGMAALYLPVLRTLLRTEPLDGLELLPALAAGLLGVLAGRVARAGDRRSRAGSGLTGAERRPPGRGRGGASRG